MNPLRPWLSFALLFVAGLFLGLLLAGEAFVKDPTPFSLPRISLTPRGEDPTQEPWVGHPLSPAQLEALQAAAKDLPLPSSSPRVPERIREKPRWVAPPIFEWVPK
jgi:hypothetical protein